MNSSQLTRIHRLRQEERIRKIVGLSRRRDRILINTEMDLQALRVLVDDYEAAGMPCAAADLSRRLEWYRASKSGEQ
jgi:hypothetical protein